MHILTLRYVHPKSYAVHMCLQHEPACERYNGQLWVYKFS